MTREDKNTCFDCKYHFMSDCYLECIKHNQINNNQICKDFEQIKEQYKADTNLKDTIREIHDNVAQEMYCKGIDDLTEKLKDYFVIPHDARIIEMMAEELKENK